MSFISGNVLSGMLFFYLTLNTDQMPVNNDNCRKAYLYIYIRERSIDLLVRSRFLDFVTVFTHISNNAELWELNPKFVTE